MSLAPYAITGAIGLCIAVLGWLLNRATQRAIQKRIGNLRSPRLRLGVGNAPLAVLDGRVSVLYVLAPEVEAKEFLGDVALCAWNEGDKAAEDVSLVLTYNDSVAVADEVMHFEEFAYGPNTQGRRQRIGNEVHISGYGPTLTPGVLFKIQDLVRLPTSTTMTLDLPEFGEGKAVQVVYSILMHGLLVSKERVWPGIDIDLNIRNEKMADAVTWFIASLESREAEQCGFDADLDPWWYRLKLARLRRKTPLCALVADVSLDSINDGDEVLGFRVADAHEFSLKRTRGKWVLGSATSPPGDSRVVINHPGWRQVISSVDFPTSSSSDPELAEIAALPVAVWFTPRWGRFRYRPPLK